LGPGSGGWRGLVGRNQEGYTSFVRGAEQERNACSVFKKKEFRYTFEKGYDY
jgi:hypothetical protein